MNCEDTRRLLDGWIDRELGLESSLAIEEHLGGCGACRLRADDLEAAKRSFSRAMAYRAAPASLGADIRRRLRGAGGPRGTRAIAWVAAGLLAIVLAAGWVGGRYHPTGGDAGRQAAIERVVFHISGRDNLRGALRNVFNHLEASPHSRVVVVAHNVGVELLVEGARDEHGVPYRPAIVALAGRGVDFRVCGNTLDRQEYETARLIPEATRVPSGIAEMARLQAKEGFVYLRL